MAGLAEILLSGNILNTFSRKCKCIIPAASVLVKKNHSNAAEGDKHYDIIITGGGMIGTTLACAIANNQRLRDIRVLLLEGGPKRNFILKPEYSNRVVTINERSQTLLSDIGAWKHVEDNRFAKINMMQVWDACSDALITFNEDKLEDDLAYVVETDLLLHAVNKELSKKNNTEVIYDAKVQRIVLPNSEAENGVVYLENGKSFTGKLLVGADGVHSAIRYAMNTKFVSWQYDQNAIVATLKLSEPTENRIAWQRFLPTGPIALLPLSNEYSSLVWSTTRIESKKLLQMSAEEFVDSVNNAFWKVYPKNPVVYRSLEFLQQMFQNFSLSDGVSRLLPPSVSNVVDKSRAKFPLGLGHAVYYVKPGAVLVGDAAHRVHPLAGQGVNLGFGDVATLVELLSETVWNGSTINDMIYLREYETRRQRHVVPTMVAIDAFHSLYRRTATPIVLARSIGLQIVNAIPALKKIIVAHASERKLKWG